MDSLWHHGIDWGDHPSGALCRAVSDYTGRPLGGASIDASGLEGPYHGRWWASLLAGHNPRPLASEGQRIDVVDLCSGIGGLSIGFKWACQMWGWEHRALLAVDMDEDVAWAHDRFEACPIADLPTIQANNALAVIGGPPCQGFSKLNPANLDYQFSDPRNDVYVQAADWAIRSGADMVMLENVEPTENAPQRWIAEERLNAAGYHTLGFKMNAAHVGWCQRRHRFFLLARRRVKPSIEPVVSQTQPALGAEWGLARPAHTHKALMPFQPKGLMKDRLDWCHDNNVWHIGKGKMPAELWRPGLDKPEAKGRANEGGRLIPDKPCPALKGGFTKEFFCPGFGHPFERRMMSAGEGATMQGFPPALFEAMPGWVSKSRAEKWIANACPAPLAAVVASALLT